MVKDSEHFKSGADAAHSMQSSLPSKEVILNLLEKSYVFLPHRGIRFKCRLKDFVVEIKCSLVVKGRDESSLGI